MSFLYDSNGNRIDIGGGVADYPDLTNKPKINGVTLEGNKTSADIGIEGGGENSIFSGKRMTIYGDSISAPTNKKSIVKAWSDWVKDILGFASVQNYAVGGYDLDAIYTEMARRRDTTNPDLVIVMGGVNDVVLGTPLGQLGDTSDTVYGAIQKICTELNAQYPLARKLIVAPAFQNRYHVTVGTVYEVGRIMKEVCDINGILCYNNLTGAEFNANNIATYVYDANGYGEGLHWNDSGHELVGKNIAQFIRDNIRSLYPLRVGDAVSISNVLEHCITDNNATAGVIGGTYHATIVADSGYTLGTVSCKMRGVAQTVTNGVIDIADITGDISIIATAT